MSQQRRSTHRNVTYKGEGYHAFIWQWPDRQIHVEIDRLRDHQFIGKVWAPERGQRGEAFMWKVRYEPSAGLNDRRDVYHLLEAVYQQMVDEEASEIALMS